MTNTRVFFLICALVSQVSTNSVAQNTPCDSVYTMVDEVPMFKNGYQDLAFYISNLDYGSCAPDEKVTLTWTIDRSGQMIDIDVLGLDGECKSRIIAQLAKYPKWTPARVMGVPVCFKMKLRKER
jgi:hypothetical protein